MQEEVTDKAVALEIKTAKLTANVLRSAMLKVLDKWKRGRDSPTVHKGKQTVKQLVGQGAGVSNIEISDGNIKSFDKVARKYGIDYAVKKDSSPAPPRYLVFFKAKDADALTAAFTEFSAKSVKRGQQKKSILVQLNKFKALVKDNVLDKVKEKIKGDRER